LRAISHRSAGGLSTVIEFSGSGEPKRKASQSSDPDCTAAAKKEIAHPFVLRMTRYAATVPSTSSVRAAAYQCLVRVSLRVSDMLRILLGCSCGFDGVPRLGAGEASEHPGAHQNEADNGGREIGRCQHRERGDARPLAGEAGR